MRIKIPKFSFRKKEKMKRYDIYIETPDDHVRIMYGYTRFKIIAWLHTKKIRQMYRDDLIIYIYDRKKGVITYEK